MLQLILQNRKKRLTDLENELMTAGVGEGIDREFGKVMYTLLYLKGMTNKDLLYSTWNSGQCYVPAWKGREYGGEWIQVYVWLSPFAVRGGKDYPLQYYGLENSMDHTVHGVTMSWTRLSNFHFQGNNNTSTHITTLLTGYTPIQNTKFEVSKLIERRKKKRICLPMKGTGFDLWSRN